MAQPLIVSICQLSYYYQGFQAELSLVTSLLAVLHRHDFEIKPVSMNRDSVLYVCTHRGSGVDINKLHQEMTLHVTAAGKTPDQFIQWTFA
ncbi:unnamed protein product [Adineta ricciae]|uniref:Uncharacterized protein n=1 Tax=Adineta ricciae TaxID=249248 RepID=A0A814M7J8_ADIRI|nr:unnamed protein product [Adineta ricciae]CAF1526028.1 unnamed protein product [Adineta ricciae]